jgi:tight adherence protein B
MDTQSYIFILLGFFAALLFLEGLFLTWNAHLGPEATRIARRLQALSVGTKNEAVTIIKNRLLSQQPLLDRLLGSVPRVRQLDKLLLQSGLRLNVAGLIGLTLLLALLGAILSMALGLPGITVTTFAVVGAVLPVGYVLRARQTRILTIEEQLPDSLDLMARAMRAGHAFASAMQMVATEMPQPIAGEFKIAFDEVNYGIPQQDALKNLAVRVPSTDLRYFVVAVLIQRETGGNLSELLTSIATLIRSRLKFLRTIRVLSAEGRLSAWILVILPIALAVVINTMNPTFLAVLWKDPVGLQMVGGALVLMIVGIFWMWRTVKIRV